MIVLDTHAWVWAVASPEKLSAVARKRISEEASLGVPAISPWEVAMLVAKKRLTLDRDVLVWIRSALAQPKMTLLPLTPEIAVASVASALHADPSDRLIVATAIDHGVELVTADANIRRARVVKCVW